jgi:hypothetical protein
MPYDGQGFEERLTALDKIDKVIDLLSREERWCKGKLRTDDGRRCIVGALQDVRAVAELTRPIMLAIEQVAHAHYSGIEAFNDHRTTTHGLVMAVLHQARQNVLGGIIGQPARVAVRTGGGWRRWLGPWAHRAA